MIQWNGHRVFGVLAMSRSIGRCPYLESCSHCSLSLSLCPCAHALVEMDP